MSYDIKRDDPEQRRKVTEFHRAKELKARKQKQTQAAERHRSETEKQAAARLRRLGQIPHVSYDQIDRDPMERK